MTTAQTLLTAVNALIDAPSAENLQAAKTAWLAARVPYQQSEVYRFGNAIVDDWEAKVNAWPLDEGLIDYVDASYGGATDENEYAVLNVIANPSFTLAFVDMPEDTTRGYQDYIGSVGTLGPAHFIVTSQRGGRIGVVGRDGTHRQAHRAADVCRTAGFQSAALVTDGTGTVHRLSGDRLSPLARHPLSFDNHLIALPAQV